MYLETGLQHLAKLCSSNNHVPRLAGAFDVIALQRAMLCTANVVATFVATDFLLLVPQNCLHACKPCYMVFVMHVCELELCTAN